MFGAKTRDKDQVERAQGEDMRDMAFIAREGQQLDPLAEVPVVDAADLFGFAERPLPAAADQGEKDHPDNARQPSARRKKQVLSWIKLRRA